MASSAIAAAVVNMKAVEEAQAMTTPHSIHSTATLSCLAQAAAATRDTSSETSSVAAAAGAALLLARRLRVDADSRGQQHLQNLQQHPTAHPSVVCRGAGVIPEGRQSKGKQSAGRQTEGRQTEGRQTEGRQTEGRQTAGRQTEGRQSLHELLARKRMLSATGGPTAGRLVGCLGSANPALRHYQRALRPGGRSPSGVAGGVPLRQRRPWRVRPRSSTEIGY
jgi:hypothetical protein